MRKVIDICKAVPLLPIVILAAIPLALIPTWRPWGDSSLFAWLGNPGVGQWIIILLVLYTLIQTVRGMIDDLRHGHVGVDLLALVALASTVAVHEYWAAWAVMLMISSGEAIEEYAESKAESNLTALIQAAPQTAHVVSLPGLAGHVHADASTHASDASEEGFRSVASSDSATDAQSADGEHFTTVPVEQVELGDVLLVLPGETVPVDGELMSGSATLDLSNINGEPVPREVFAGARVMSGAVNGSTTLTMRVTQLAKNSQYQRILELVAGAQDSRAAVVKTADVLAVPFTILAFIIAGVAWAVSGLPLRFVQVLVLATPCPLLIAAPVAYMAGTGRLAKAGILVKTQDVLENLGKVSHIFFDKTGTLTVKQPQVVRVERPAEDDGTFSDDQILVLAGVVENYSVHILSQGIAKAGKAAGERLRGGKRVNTGIAREYPVVKDVSEESGKGVTGEVNGHAVRVGRYAFVTASDSGFTPVSATATADASAHFGTLEPDEMAAYVAIDGTLVARIVLRDVPRANAAESLARLHALGVNKLSMLTGDKAASAAIIASEVGIDDVQSELFPEDKVNAVKTATSETPTKQSWWSKLTGTAGRAITMMVGDGVNDAPVLAAADIGMAMTDGTSTAASESAQVVIMNDDIASVPKAIAIARRTKRVMLQAVLIGLGLAIIGMIAAAFNLIPVVVGAFLQEAIDVVSILWALTALIDHD